MFPIITDDGLGAMLVLEVRTTVTVWVAEARLPLASVAVQVTVVVPADENVTGALFVTLTPGQSSVAVAVPRTADDVPTTTVTGGGALIVGDCRSITVTV